MNALAIWFRNNAFVRAITNIWSIPELKTKMLWTMFFLFIYRIGFHIPIPLVNTAALDALRHELATTLGGDGGFVSFVDLVSGGGLADCTLFSIGIMPYISASIIFSLLTKIVPALDELSKEGERGRKKLGQYTKYLAVLLCIVQSFMMINLIQNVQTTDRIYLIDPEDRGLFFISTVFVLTTGGMFLVWLSEQISEYGIGNGASVVIMCGIIARLPSSLRSYVGGLGSAGGDIKTHEGEMLLRLCVFVLMLIAVIALVVLMTQGQRRISIQNPKIARGQKIYGGNRATIPLRVNQAGVMPVIFASSLIIFPSMIFGYIAQNLQSKDPGWQQSISSFFAWIASTLGFGNFWYVVLYIAAVFFFSFFWNQLMFNPTDLSKQWKEAGAFIPGVRPGRETAKFLQDILVRITFVGAVFLCFIALFPQVVSSWLSIEYSLAAFLGGTSLLIMVSVVLDIVQKVESHLVVREYEGLAPGARGGGRQRRSRR
ncbi:MAG: preprotein translocase subunit SecY [Planctomycetes bacterium]|nr:preprotein translocase subunit SecY [Planctomycetota bacterium]